MYNGISSISTSECEDQVFIWHDINNDCIEIWHGTKCTKIKLEKDTDVLIIPLSTYPDDYDDRFLIHDENGHVVASLADGAGPGGSDLIIVRYRRQNVYFVIPHGTRFRVEYSRARHGRHRFACSIIPNLS